MTTKLLILAAAFVLCGAAELPEYKPGRLVSRGISSRLTTDATAQCLLKGEGTHCSSNNCETALMCYGGSAIALEIPCTAEAKYCDSSSSPARCTATKPTTCPTTQTDFVCNMAGHFPDPTNCELFYYCPNAKASPTVYDCEPGYAVDINAQACKRRNFPSDCAIMNCTEKTPIVSYALNPAYYAYCLKTGDGYQASVWKCPDEVYQVFNTISYVCEVSCKAEGNQQDTSNCQRYNYCYKSGGKWAYKTIDCPLHPTPDTAGDFMAFNPVTKRCDPTLPTTCPLK